MTRTDNDLPDPAEDLGQRISDALADAYQGTDPAAWLAVQIGMSRSTVNRWITGETEPSFRNMIFVAWALGKPVGYFAGPASKPEATHDGLVTDLRSLLLKHRSLLEAAQRDVDRALAQIP